MRINDYLLVLYMNISYFHKLSDVTFFIMCIALKNPTLSLLYFE